jgi:hypothetical protein
MTSRELDRAARRLADQSSDAVAELPSTRVLYLTVTALAPVTVSWRGVAIKASAVCASYTPAVGHRVICLYDGLTLTVLDRTN